MPELPEVETVVRGLQQLRGKRIARVDVRQPKLVSIGPATLSPRRIHTHQDARRFARSLVGRRIMGVRRRAKLILWTLDHDWFLLVHLKMAGQIIIQRRAQKTLLVRLLNTPTAPLEALPSKHTHIIVHFTDGTRVYYNDLRRFGTWRLVQGKHLDRVADLASYGPEPLHRSFTWQKLKVALTRRPTLPLKQALTEQSILAGVGNIYADELLFAARLLPTRKTSTLVDGEWRVLFRSLQGVLRRAIRTHGSSVGDFIRPDGTPGTYGRYHKVYGRKGKPCPRCGTPIQRTVLGGRGTHFCSRCQR